MRKKTKNIIGKLDDDQIINIIRDALCEFEKKCEKKLGFDAMELNEALDAKNYVQHVGFFLLGSSIARKTSKATLKKYLKEILDNN